MKRVLLVLLILSVVTVGYANFRAAEAVIIPASAITAGGGGTFWQTDLTIFNPNDFDVYITIWFIPSGFGGGYTALELDSPIPAGQSSTLNNILSYFTDNGSGALFVWGEDAGAFFADIIATSRTYTPNPDSTIGGTYGQSIPGLPWYYFADPSYAAEGLDHLIIMDIANTDDFRTNLGILNVSDSVSETIAVEIFDGSGISYGVKTYDLGPLAQIQRSNILNEWGLTGSGFMAVVSVAGFTGDGLPAVMAYGSKVDNNTGDPTYLEASFTVRPNIDCIWPE